jgi:hypothetical protein
VKHAGNSELYLYNAYGQVILKETVSGDEHMVNVPRLAPGQYVVKLVSGRGVVVRPLIVCK